MLRKFNWGRVIRHELVHIFNLAQTDYLVPHWLTEGLAVRNEKMARPAMWSQVLRGRFEKNDLLTLDNIMLAFVRPRNQLEWALAYCQAQLYVEFMITTYGQESVGKMLDAYHDGLETAAAIRKVCKVDVATFEKGYKAYVTKIVQSIPTSGKSSDKAMTLDELKKAHEKDPDDIGIAASLAEQYARRKRNDDARKLADEILEKEKNHPIASVVKGKLLIADGEEEEARKLLESAAKANPEDSRCAEELGKLCIANKEWTEAAKWYERCQALHPGDVALISKLALIYENLGNKEKLAAMLKEAASADADDIEPRQKLAELLLETKDYPGAEAAARETLMIDVGNETGRKVLIEALKGQDKKEEAERMAKRFRE